MSHEAHSEHSGHHVVPISTYFKLLIVLMFFMILTIVAYNLDFTHWFGEVPGTFVNNFVALAIAVTKATFVIMIFMGVKWASKLAKMYAMLGFACLGLFGIAFCDYGSRHMEAEPGWEGQKLLKVTNVIMPPIDEEAVKRAHVEGGAEH